MCWAQKSTHGTQHTHVQAIWRHPLGHKAWHRSILCLFLGFFTASVVVCLFSGRYNSPLHYLDRCVGGGYECWRPKGGIAYEFVYIRACSFLPVGQVVTFLVRCGRCHHLWTSEQITSVTLGQAPCWEWGGDNTQCWELWRIIYFKYLTFVSEKRFCHN